MARSAVSQMAFTVLEIDEDHDLALCHINGFRVYSPDKSPTAKIPLSTAEGALSHDQMSSPFASLAISKKPIPLGRLVLVSGFPLGSWTPAIQLGLVSATETRYPPEIPVSGTPKAKHEFLQISVNANHGNSGGPVIDLASGEVLGVILQLVPAPMQIQGHQILDNKTFAMSGIMLAAPAAWVDELLEKRNIHSQSTKAGKLVIW